jgi:hypothetical protein
MTMENSSHFSEWHRLFIAKADGTITADDHERLARLLKDSAEARREWFAFQDAETGLLAWSQRETLQRGEMPAASAAAKHEHGARTSVRSHMKLMLLGSMAAGIVIGAVTWAMWPQRVERLSPSGSNVVTRDEATTSAVAVLTRGVDLVWERGTTAPALDEPLSPGEFKLRSGVAEIEFFQGARLCMEGPATIRLVSAKEAFCSSGRFSAEVPFQARGFRLGTPKGDLVDLGTEFGLDLNSAAPALHVFKGEVEWHPSQTKMRLFTTGQATGLQAGDSAKSLVADPAAFSFSRDLDARVISSQRQALEQWQQASASWNSDPALRLRLDFQDGEGSRSLKNSAPEGQDIVAGTIVGCTWTQGRWPGKQALQFRSISDRARLNIPGSYKQLTLSASVQLHGLNIRQSSLCMSQGLAAGYMHWQVLHDGSLCLGVGVNEKPIVWEDYISPVVFTPERIGQWVHLAVVYDAEGGEVRFFVNGACLSRHPMKKPVVLTPALVELGNWTPSPDKRQQPVRNFAGCMDEFSLFSRALSDAEVRKLAQ